MFIFGKVQASWKKASNNNNNKANEKKKRNRWVIFFLSSNAECDQVCVCVWGQVKVTLRIGGSTTDYQLFVSLSLLHWPRYLSLLALSVLNSYWNCCNWVQCARSYLIAATAAAAQRHSGYKSKTATTTATTKRGSPSLSPRLFRLLPAGVVI